MVSLISAMRLGVWCQLWTFRVSATHTHTHILQPYICMIYTYIYIYICIVDVWVTVNFGLNWRGIACKCLFWRAWRVGWGVGGIGKEKQYANWNALWSHGYVDITVSNALHSVYLRSLHDKLLFWLYLRVFRGFFCWSSCSYLEIPWRCVVSTLLFLCSSNVLFRGRCMEIP